MVGQHGILFAVDLIKDHFGDIVSKVCGCLLRRGSLTLQEIIKDTEMVASQVKNCLLVLIQHNCVQAYSVPRPAAIGVAPKVITMYMALFENIIHRLRFVKFMKIVADDLGPQRHGECKTSTMVKGKFKKYKLTVKFDVNCIADAPYCEALLEGLLQHGRLTFEQLLERALSRKGNVGDRDSLLASFNQLVLAHYVERCPKPEPFLSPSTEEEAPPARKRVDKSAIDTMTMEKKALADATLSDAQRFAVIVNTGDDIKIDDKSSKITLGICQKRKRETLEMDKQTQATIVEKEVLWRANFEMFVNCLKKKACASYKRSRLGLDAGVILEAMIESCSGHLRDTVTSSLDNIFERVIAKPRAHVMNLQHVRRILEELGCEQSIEDQVTFYTIDLKSIIRDCQTDEVEAIVLKRYGKDAYRIFRLLANKNQALETEKIADVTFVDKKNANIILYKLWKDNILLMERMSSQEQRKVYFLWKVNRSATWGKILDDMYHAAANLNQRIVYNYEQDKEVADLPAKLRTSIQKEKYVRYSNRRVVLENSLLKIDGLLMLFHDFQVSPV